MIYPFCTLITRSFFSNKTAGFTFENYIRFFTKKYYYSALGRSLFVSIVTTYTTLLVGVPIAYIMSRYNVFGKSFIHIFIIMSLMSPPFIGAYSWIMLFGRAGFVTRLFANIGIHLPSIYGKLGIILVFTFKLFPYVYLYTSGAMGSIDSSIEEAAENLGSNKLRRLLTVTLPVVAPSIAAGAIMVFMTSLADFGTPMLIGEGYRTFPVVLYTEFINEVGGSDGFAAAIAVIAIVVTTLVFLVQKYVSNKNAFALNSMHPVEEREARKGINALVHLVVYLVVGIAIMPQAYVIYTSFKNTQGKIFVDGYSLQSYQTAIGKLGRSIQNTIIIPLLALVVIVLLAVLIAYLVVRRRNALTNVVDVLSMIPYIVPGTVLGIALLIGFNKPRSSSAAPCSSW